MSPDPLLAACRFVHDGSLMTLWGAFAFLAALVPQRLAATVAARLTTFRLAAAGLALVATLLSLPLQAAIIGDGWPDAVSRQMLADVVASTGAGRAWLAQAAAVVVLAAAQALPSRARTAATAIASGAALGTLALTGHAVMQDGWQGAAHQINHVLHVLSAGAWFGALLPLLIILAGFGQATLDKEAAVALRRFSTAGHWAVALAILSGIANSLFIVGWPLSWSSAYQELLAAKILVVLVMTAVAILNRYWFVPHLSRGRMSTIGAIRTGTRVEMGLGLAAILLVAIFGMLDPDGDAGPPVTTETSNLVSVQLIGKPVSGATTPMVPPRDQKGTRCGGRAPMRELPPQLQATTCSTLLKR